MHRVVHTLSHPTLTASDKSLHLRDDPHDQHESNPHAHASRLCCGGFHPAASPAHQAVGGLLVRAGVARPAAADPAAADSAGTGGGASWRRNRRAPDDPSVASATANGAERVHHLDAVARFSGRAPRSRRAGCPSEYAFGEKSCLLSGSVTVESPARRARTCTAGGLSSSVQAMASTLGRAQRDALARNRHRTRRPWGCSRRASRRRRRLRVRHVQPEGVRYGHAAPSKDGTTILGGERGGGDERRLAGTAWTLAGPTPRRSRRRRSRASPSTRQRARVGRRLGENRRLQALDVAGVDFLPGQRRDGHAGRRARGARGGLTTVTPLSVVALLAPLVATSAMAYVCPAPAAPTNCSDSIRAGGGQVDDVAVGVQAVAGHRDERLAGPGERPVVLRLLVRVDGGRRVQGQRHALGEKHVRPRSPPREGPPAPRSRTRRTTRRRGFPSTRPSKRNVYATPGGRLFLGMNRFGVFEYVVEGSSTTSVPSEARRGYPNVYPSVAVHAASIFSMAPTTRRCCRRGARRRSRWWSPRWRRTFCTACR